MELTQTVSSRPTRLETPVCEVPVRFVDVYWWEFCVAGNWDFYGSHKGLRQHTSAWQEVDSHRFRLGWWCSCSRNGSSCAWMIVPLTIRYGNGLRCCGDSNGFGRRIARSNGIEWHRAYLGYQCEDSTGQNRLVHTDLTCRNTSDEYHDAKRRAWIWYYVESGSETVHIFEVSDDHISTSP